MKKFILLFVMIGAYGFVQAQANNTFAALELGQKKCLFKYTESSKTFKLKTGKDSTATTKALTLQDDVTKSTRIMWLHDTVQTTNRKGKKDTKIISNNNAEYHIETEMSYSDFLILLKSKFEIKNPQKNFRVYSFDIYYETADTGGYIKIKYPDTYEGVITKLNCLTKNGFLLLALKGADHDDVSIDTQGRFLALIRIKN